MTWLLEQQMPILLTGAIAVVVLLVVMYQVQKAWAMVAVFVAALVTAGLSLTEYLVVTERERVEGTLDSLDVALEANDAAAISAHIDNERLKELARTFLDWVTIENVKFSNLKIVTNDLTSPPSASATFMVRVDFESKKATLRDFVIDKVRLRFVKKNDQWLIDEATSEGIPGLKRP